MHKTRAGAIHPPETVSAELRQLRELVYHRGVRMQEEIMLRSDERLLPGIFHAAMGLRIDGIFSGKRIDQV
jgi:hypothetical protein